MSIALRNYQSDVERFVDSGAERNTLGLVYGRRRIGKSTLLEEVTHNRGGFYWEASRSETPIQLARLGEALGAHLGVGRIAFDNWDDAFSQLLRIGDERAVPVILDEFGYILEAERSTDSVLASALGPDAQRRNPGQARLILCGSAIAMMRALTAGQAPLRGRAGMELVMQAGDFRDAAEHLGSRPSLDLAAQVFAVIGGVIGYATDMVDHDLPQSSRDFDRWIAARLLSPAATLFHEASTLLAEDPALSTGSQLVHHSILGAIANGSITAGTIAKRLKRSTSNIDPALKRLIDSGFVNRFADPIRERRPTYALADPFLQFHYAVLEPHGPLLRARDPIDTWRDRLRHVFDSRVRGPVFEEQTRTWVQRYAEPGTIGGPIDFVGPSVAQIEGTTHQLDVVVATADPIDAPPQDRTVLAIGEAKAGETVGSRHLEHLEKARAALGPHAAHAKLLLFAPEFTPALSSQAGRRSDVELIDLERLYRGS